MEFSLCEKIQEEPEALWNSSQEQGVTGDSSKDLKGLSNENILLTRETKMVPDGTIFVTMRGDNIMKSKEFMNTHITDQNPLDLFESKDEPEGHPSRPNESNTPLNAAMAKVKASNESTQSEDINIQEKISKLSIERSFKELLLIENKNELNEETKSTESQTQSRTESHQGDFIKKGEETSKNPNLGYKREILKEMCPKPDTNRKLDQKRIPADQNNKQSRGKPSGIIRMGKNSKVPFKDLSPNKTKENFIIPQNLLNNFENVLLPSQRTGTNKKASFISCSSRNESDGKENVSVNYNTSMFEHLKYQKQTCSRSKRSARPSSTANTERFLNLKISTSQSKQKKTVRQTKKINFEDTLKRMNLKEARRKEKIEKMRRSKKQNMVEVKPKESKKKMSKKKFKILMSRFDHNEAKRKKQILRMRKKKETKAEAEIKSMFRPNLGKTARVNSSLTRKDTKISKNSSFKALSDSFNSYVENLSRSHRIRGDSLVESSSRYFRLICRMRCNFSKIMKDISKNSDHNVECSMMLGSSFTSKGGKALIYKCVIEILESKFYKPISRCY
ncbi:unnamed protein product [Moneuplotes crassus]|uniref:Uncharacterized protein n=1 Tax=Euplotes crassus TaxID=5936 RepID=A0AAD1Y6H7_EUPCR|nr:unnamed protein product [Moneuplotes crassus]